MDVEVGVERALGGKASAKQLSLGAGKASQAGERTGKAKCFGGGGGGGLISVSRQVDFLPANQLASSARHRTEELNRLDLVAASDFWLRLFRLPKCSWPKTNESIKSAASKWLIRALSLASASN